VEARGMGGEYIPIWEYVKHEFVLACGGSDAEKLFASRRFYGVYRRSAPRRDEAGQQCRGTEQGCRGEALSHFRRVQNARMVAAFLHTIGLRAPPFRKRPRGHAGLASQGV
jgi:hypothetical protein